MTIQYPNTSDYSVDPPAQVIECDVVIVGTGAGGGIAAEVLSRSGFKVLMIEEGPLKTSADFKMNEKEAYAELYQEIASRQTVDKSIQILQGRAVGGSTTVNWTASFRTPKSTLAHWQKVYAISGLSSEELSPSFDWAEKRLNISPWALSPNANNQLLADGAKKLGWKYNVIPRNVKGCANLGYCGMGCPIDAKQSMLVSCIPTALKLGAKLISRARVESLVIKGDKTLGVKLTSLNHLGQIKQKNITTVKAKHTVLSAGAIGTPAIMIRSQLTATNPLIGQRTFLHPVTASMAEMPNKVNGFSGAPQSIYSDQFLWRDGVEGELGYKIEVPPLHPLLISTVFKQHGQRHSEKMQGFANFQATLALIRDGFNEQSIGGSVVLDEYHYPQLDYSPNNMLWRGLKHAMLSMTEIQFAAGANKVNPIHMDSLGYTSWNEAKSAIKSLPTEILRWQVLSAHVMGGSPMGKDPQHSVCDSEGKFHQLDHLSVLDGSLFPTSLGVNPQLTIYAIVAKLSTKLVNKLGGQLPEDLARL